MEFPCRASHRSLFAVTTALLLTAPAEQAAAASADEQTGLIFGGSKPQGLMSSLSIEGMKIRRIKC